MALVDCQSGTVFEVPFEILPMAAPELAFEGKYSTDQDNFEALSYKLDSRLLVVRGCPEEKNCGSYFYEWMGSKFNLLRKIPAVPLRQ